MIYQEDAPEITVLWHSCVCNTSHCGFVVPQMSKFHKNVSLFYPQMYHVDGQTLEFIKLYKTWCVTWVSYLQLVCICKGFFFFSFVCWFVCFQLWVQQVLFIFLHWFSERVKTQKKKQKKRISVLYWHKFHLLQINSSEINVSGPVLPEENPIYL